MKKKLILSVICTILLSFGAMAKSDYTTFKVIHDVDKNHSKVHQKTIKSNVTCVIVLLSCMRALACGSSTTSIVNEAFRLEDALCG
jgi:hypothetical protein